MVITNAASAIIKLFVADPTKAYNIREIAKNTNINYRLIYNAVLVLERSTEGSAYWRSLTAGFRAEE